MAAVKRALSAVPGLIAREPALSAGTVQCVIALAAGLGLHLTGAEVTGGAAVLSLLAAAVVRSRVQPARKPAPQEAPPVS